VVHATVVKGYDPYHSRRYLMIWIYTIRLR
jgi:hypothetical protein